jgi:hypothetical protein
MSVSDLQQVMIRINGCAPESPIAVFKTNRPGMLDSVFASTIRTQEMMRDENSGLIGVYDGSMNIDRVFSELSVKKNETIEVNARSTTPP